jgi:hypothetical protein
MTSYDKLALEKSRLLITGRLDMPRLPFDCKRCRYEIRCASLAPSRPVLCELSDDACGVTLPEPKAEDYEKCTEENAEYYLKVHVLGA